MAGKAIIPFNEASSTFTLEGEPSSANLALAVMEDDQEAEGPPAWFGQTRGSAGPFVGAPHLPLRCGRREDRQWRLGDVLGFLVDFHDCKGEVHRRGLSHEGECGRNFVEWDDCLAGHRE